MRSTHHDMRTSSRSVATALGIVLSLFAPGLAVADTHVSGGHYNTDQHWTLAGSPCIIDGWVWFETSLVIDPGVTVILGPGVADISNTIDGTLSAIGTESSRITITSQADAVGGNRSPGRLGKPRHRQRRERRHVLRRRAERGTAAPIIQARTSTSTAGRSGSRLRRS